MLKRALLDNDVNITEWTPLKGAASSQGWDQHRMRTCSSHLSTACQLRRTPTRLDLFSRLLAACRARAATPCPRATTRSRAPSWVAPIQCGKRSRCGRALNALTPCP
eukprot:804944-Pleurochrysis_carterae.AAC.1